MLVVCPQDISRAQLQTFENLSTAALGLLKRRPCQNSERSAAVQVYWNKTGKVLHKKKFQIPQDWIKWHQDGRRFIVLGHQCVRRDVMWKCSCCVLFSLYFWYCLLPPQCPCQQDRPHDETEIFPTQAENAFVVLKLLFWAPVLIWKLGGNYVLRVWKKILKIVMRLISPRPAQSKC